MVQLPTNSHYELVTMRYRQYADLAMQVYAECDIKASLYHSNHQFTLPKTLDDILFDNPFTHDYDRKYHSEIDSLDTASETTALSSVLGQKKYAPGDDFFEQVKNYFGYKYAFVTVNCLKQGDHTCVHVDRVRSMFVHNIPEEQAYKVPVGKVHRMIAFVDDQRHGDFFQVGEEFVKWKAGDIIEIPWYMPHATANCSDRDRYLLSIMGVYEDDLA